MYYPAGSRTICYLRAVLAVASPLWAYGGEGKLAPVVDLNPRHTEAASSSLQEPSALIVEATAIQLPSDALPSGVSPTELRLGKLHSAVRFAAPFDPTKQVSQQQNAAPVKPPTAAARLAPVIRVYEPVRQVSLAPRQNTPSQNTPLGARSVDVQKPARSVVSPLAANPPRRIAPLILEAAPTPIEPVPSALASNVGKENKSAKAEPILMMAEEVLLERDAPSEALAPETPSAITASPVIQFADAQPLLAALQPSPSALDLPVPMAQPELAEEQLTEEQLAELEEINAFEHDLKPIHAVFARTKPEMGEMPKNYAAARFAREGTIAHGMGFSRAHVETIMMWEAPAVCHRPLYFEDINLERHGYKVPLVQPALSLAHFFGRVPMLPYMMVNEGHRKCNYTLGHYRPGDYAPYSLYVPRLRLDASAAQLAFAAGVIFAFP
ncbi:MAG TPA: hypothetical protein VMM76_23505 [Pirellulaceae bacterium]|nr:hypothetical protein [Pirellulaceae bacterium]